MLEIKPNSVLAKKLSTGEETPIIAIKGDAGVSPSASVERVEDGAKITITDISGTTSSMVYDGQSTPIDFIQEANNTELSNLTTTNKTTVGSLNEVNLKAMNISSEYDSAHAYVLNDYCVYDGVLYRCTSATTGEFDLSKWESVKVTDVLGGDANYVELTRSDYEALPEAEKMNGTIYFITDGQAGGVVVIDDDHTSADKVWSSQKTYSELSTKQTTSSSELQTADKTIVGAINEVNEKAEGGGGNADYKEITKSEYINLPEEEKMNGTMYFITDGQAGGGAVIDDTSTSTDKVWSSQKVESEIGTIARCMSIRKTFTSGTSIVDAMSSIISEYGKHSLMGGFIIMGYGFCSFSISFSDDNQGSGYVTVNNKGSGGNTPVMYLIQYVNGTCTLGYPWVSPT